MEFNSKVMHFGKLIQTRSYTVHDRALRMFVEQTDIRVQVCSSMKAHFAFVGLGFGHKRWDDMLKCIDGTALGALCAVPVVQLYEGCS